MDPLTYFIMLLISVALSVALAPKPEDRARPASEEDIDIPTAIDKPIQLVYGRTRMKSPNVGWAGNFKKQKVVEKIKKLWDSDKITLGYKYRYSLFMMLGFGDQDVRVHGLWANNKKVGIVDENASSSNQPKSGFYGTVFVDGVEYIDDPDFEIGPGQSFKFGNKADATSKDMSATTIAGELYLHNMTAPPAGLAALEPEFPVYKNIFGIWLNDLYMGVSAQLPKLEFEVSRYPKIDGAPAGIERIGYDCNAAFLCYELFQSKMFGLGMPESLLDKQSFIDCAQALYDEGIGISGIISTSSGGKKVLEDIQRHTSSVIRQNYVTGKWEMKLLRKDYDAEAIQVFDSSNVLKVNKFSRANSAAMPNELRIRFRDREQAYKEATITCQNIADIHAKRTVPRTYDYSMFKSRATAEIVAGREMRANSIPLSSARLTLNREAYGLNAGDVFLLDRPDLNINSVMRVLEANAGSIGSGSIVVDAIEDVFGLDYTGFTIFEDVTNNDNTDPVNLDHTLIIEAPMQMGAGSLLIAGRNQSDEEFYTGIKSPTDTDYQFNDAPETFVAIGFLKDAFAQYSDSIEVNNFIGVPEDTPALSEDQRREGLNLCFIEDGADSEFISYENYTATANGLLLNGVWRGLLDTPPKAHSAGAKIWFLSDDRVITTASFDSGLALDIKLPTSDNINVMPIADATVHQITTTGSGYLDPPPGFLRVEDVGDGATVAAGDIKFKSVNRSDQLDYRHYFDTSGYVAREEVDWRYLIKDDQENVIYDQTEHTLSRTIEILIPGDYTFTASAVNEIGEGRSHTINFTVTV